MAGFAGIPGINPILATILAQPVQAAALHPGQILQGVVQSIEPQALIRFGGLTVPVEQVEGIQPGQPVTAEVVRNENGLQLRITPNTAGGATLTQPGATYTAAGDLSTTLVDVLRTMGRLDLAGRAANLIPAHVAANSNAVRLVLTVLLDRGTTGGDAQRLAQIVQTAVDDGILTPQQANAVLPALRSLTADSGDEFTALLRRSAQSSQQPIEARLAEAIAKGTVQQMVDSLRSDLTAVLSRLRANPEFSEFLNRTGIGPEFDRGSERIADRFTAAQLVNSRGADVPYLFFEFPFPADSPLRHAQIHVMGDGGGRGQRFDHKNSTVVFDLSTTALGDLWITLSATQGACSCWIRARDVETVAAFEELRGELAAQLALAGYPHAVVQTTLWDGDRVGELATMMRQFKGINIQA